MPNKVFLSFLYFPNFQRAFLPSLAQTGENLDFSINFPISRVDRRVVVGTLR